MGEAGKDEQVVSIPDEADEYFMAQATEARLSEAVQALHALRSEAVESFVDALPENERASLIKWRYVVSGADKARTLYLQSLGGEPPPWEATDAWRLLEAAGRIPVDFARTEVVEPAVAASTSPEIIESTATDTEIIGTEATQEGSDEMGETQAEAIDFSESRRINAVLQASAERGEDYVRELMAKSPGKPVAETATIEPDLAISLRLYAEKKGLTKAPDVKAAENYAKAMVAGKWILNGMPLAFDRSGRLIDGMARLMACERAGTPFITLVVANLPAESEVAIDRHKKRTFANVIAFHERDNPAVDHRIASAAAASLLKLIRLDQQLTGDGKIEARHGVATLPWSTLERYYAANRETLIAAAQYAMDDRFSDSWFPDPARVPLAYVAYRMGDEGKTALEALFDGYFRHLQAFRRAEKGRGEVLPDDGSPSHKLFDQFRNENQARPALAGRENPVVVWAKACQALEDQLVRGGAARTSMYSWSGQGAFPAPSGYPGMTPPLNIEGELATAQSASATAYPDIKVSIEYGVDRAKALEWLSQNTNNRKIQVSHRNALVRDIKAKEFLLSSHPICFGVSGRLLNGQHRLTALLAASEENPEATIDILVVRGLPDEDAAFATYDLHARRPPSLKDGEKNDTVIAIARLYHRLVAVHEEGGGKVSERTELTDAGLRRLVGQHEALFREAKAYGKELSALGQEAVVGYAALRMLQAAQAEGVDEDTVRGYLRSLGTGLEIRKEYKRLAAARTELIRIRSAKAGERAQARGYRLHPAVLLWEAFERDVLGRDGTAKHPFAIPELTAQLRLQSERARKADEAIQRHRARTAGLLTWNVEETSDPDGEATPRRRGRAKANVELLDQPKRGRGRPRKNPPPDPNAPKRGRGRPRKNPPPEATDESQLNLLDAVAQAQVSDAEQQVQAEVQAEAEAPVAAAIAEAIVPDAISSAPLTETSEPAAEQTANDQAATEAEPQGAAEDTPAKPRRPRAKAKPADAANVEAVAEEATTPVKPKRATAKSAAAKPKATKAAGAKKATVKKSPAPKPAAAKPDPTAE